MRYTDTTNTTILADDRRTIPAVAGNRDFDELIARRIPVAPYTKPRPTADDVRTEASRRMQALVGARDARHLELIITNGTREAVRLLRQRNEKPWSKIDTARADNLAAVDQAIEAIRAASNALEAEPPVDFADDRHWKL